MSPAKISAPRPKTREELVGVARGLLTLPGLARDWSALPRGMGRPVLVLPGFMTGDPATLVLRRVLAGLGYSVYGWGLGRNHGRLERLVPQVSAQISSLSARHGQALNLVGWSLGGVIARESTRSDPTRVARIVTMGTPVIGGPKYTAAAPRYAARNYDLDALERRVAERNAEPLPVPITAVYSKRDGIVAWQACIDPNPDNQVEHVEVDAAHSELGFSPEVLRIVATRLGGRGDAR